VTTSELVAIVAGILALVAWVRILVYAGRHR
jgi:hypothetical protein